MRTLSSLIARGKSPARRPLKHARRSEEKRPEEARPAPRPAPKRCLNEAAHKLDR